MADKPLPADAAALWARVAATVTPLARERPATPGAPAPSVLSAIPVPAPERGTADAAPARRIPASLRPAPATPSDTLDGGWDRRLRRGVVSPDWSIDLHGHTLATAQAALEAALSRAVAEEARVLLVVTGKPPRPGEGRRGLIRASIFDWLARSRYASRIAAVRNAHPRHGGAGALYLILRRRRGE